MKNDHSIRNICIAAIKRHTIKPIDFSFASILETELAPKFSNGLAVIDGELPVARTFIDKDNWTFVTTRSIIVCDQGKIHESLAGRIKSWYWGDFNVYKDDPVIMGGLKLDNGILLKVHIERGKASMITIYAIMTLVKQVRQ
jgi:hypothetical protein